jgi:hypothetical protein
MNPNLKKPTIFVLKIIYKLPMRLQHLIFRTIIEARFIFFRIKLMHHTNKNVPDPARVYWISPERIVYHTNYLKNENAETVPFRDRSFHPEEMRGKVVDGNWDISNYKFADLDVYTSFKKRLEAGVEWQNTEFYARVLRQVESGEFVWGINNKDSVDKRFNYLDSLVDSIKNEGYRLSRNIYDKNIEYDEIDVNIGRNGEYLFQNGVHRLSIAKILGIKYVPVMVFVRHKEWQEFREFVISYAQQKGGKLYQPIVHPDLADVPYQLQAYNPQDLIEAIKSRLGKKRGIMLDIGANLGFFCHKFEDLGYQCYAIEQDPAIFQILEKIRIAENKKFQAINKSIFEVEFIKNTKFDVVLALNIFHHFLKRKTDFYQLKDLLKKLETTELFFEPHCYHEAQMKDAYVNYTEAEFVDFLLRHTSLNKSEVIYTAKSGRHVFKLSK